MKHHVVRNIARAVLPLSVLSCAFATAEWTTREIDGRIEAAHDGILILDARRKITHVNPFLTNLLDYPAEHFLGLGSAHMRDGKRQELKITLVE